ncbi:hypothetical protein J3A84_12455 [Proteiniclasticum sp. SCR006]|uniref:Uncharacterized protein n=1 Tax=Proteiniclasticum aestuarii TaxID=2817862 RepID=A0A939KK46_9CLOT|nr:hypothetical protein [Proteiniclasticum aestuarii]MBO1265843.1 hypothetical protein [Proteiniclasticum aestuarii]
MSVEKNENKEQKPKFYEAPESGTIRQEIDPSQPEGAAKDDAKSAPSEAPESGTMREK